MKYVLVALSVASCMFGVACDDGATKGAYARRIAQPNQLIGGPKAMGTIGDFLLANQHIRVIIQNQGWSRGFGVFGGGIIDADLVRAGDAGNSAGGNGRDHFGEMFPMLFLQAFDVQDYEERDAAGKLVRTLPGVEILADGSDGGAAIIRTRAQGGDFLTLIANLLAIALPKGQLRFETDYVLNPEARHVEIIGRLINTGKSTVDLSGRTLKSLLASFGVSDLQLPLGDISLFGASNTVFAPGAVYRVASETDARLPTQKRVGFDVRYALEATHAIPLQVPAMAGVVTEFLATAGREVSYGFALAPSDRNFVWLNRGEYAKDPKADVTDHSLVVPFLMSAFAGSYSVVPPDSLAAGASFEYRRYFIVGDGDVASVRDELYRIRGVDVGTFEGRVVSERFGDGVAGASVHIFDEQQRAYSQARTDETGRFRAALAPGVYYYEITAEGRHIYPTAYAFDAAAGLAKTRIVVAADKGTYAYVRLPDAASLRIAVRDTSGKPLPAKVSVVGHYDAAYDGLAPNDFLYDASVGERRRNTDFSWREPAGVARQREYIETIGYTEDGLAHIPVRPNGCAQGATCTQPSYDIYVSRGMEYDLFVQRDVTFKAGETVELDAVLERVVDTTDYLSADFHVHGYNSIDSGMPLADRVRSAAGEGLEVIVATDHQFLTDYRPVITGLDLQDWTKSVISVELTTLEMGHFNGFPLKYDLSSVSHFPFVGACYEPRKNKTNGSAFDWVQCAPGQLFSNLRELGSLSPQKTVVQVNHPRDSIMGYFSQFYVNPYTLVPDERSSANYPLSDLIYPNSPETGQFNRDKFSYDFNAIEVWNGKRYDLLHAFTLPNDVPDDVVTALQDYRCKGGHPNNARGAKVLRKGGHVAYPGAVDDWMRLLNAGYRMTATGNSDSHGDFDEVGTPRNYLYVKPRGQAAGDAFPNAVSDTEIADSVLEQKVLVSYGPFLLMHARAAGASQGEVASIGGTLSLPASQHDVEVEFTLRHAAWVDVKEIVLFVNGVATETITVPPLDSDATKRDDVFKVQVSVPRDAVLVAEARGERNLFPVVVPNEEPPLSIASAVRGFGGLGSGLTSFLGGTGVDSPSYWQKVTPFALTNAIWVDADGDGVFDPPGNDSGPGPAPNDSCPTPPTALIVPDKTSQLGDNYARVLMSRALRQAQRIEMKGH